MRHNRPAQDELPWPAWIALGLLVGWFLLRLQKSAPVPVVLPRATMLPPLSRAGTAVAQRAMQAQAQPILAAKASTVSPNAFGQVVSKVVSTDPIRVLETSRTGARKVTIIADAEIRVLDSPGVTPTRGVIIPRNTVVAWPDAIGGDVQLYAVRVGGVDANVSVIAQPVEEAAA